jgi:Domain of unknown function (DUF4157)
MDPLDILRAIGGCAGGKVIYDTAETALKVRHPVRKRRRLMPETAVRLQPLYAGLDLRSVTFITSASFPANWFQSPDQTLAMTFGSQIWFKWKRSHVEETEEGLLVLMHELVHVLQFRRLGSSKSAFACAYGLGYLSVGDYASNPLEAEAFRFMENNRLPPPTPTGRWFGPVRHIMTS